MCEKKQHYSTKPPRWEVPVRFLVKTWASALPERNPASGLRNKPAGVKTKSRTENHFQWQAPYDIIKYKVMAIKEAPLWAESLDSHQLFLEMKNPF